jgi:hypothetical protein
MSDENKEIVIVGAAPKDTGDDDFKGLDEKRARAWARKHYGIEDDDPTEHKRKIDRLREEAAQIPKYKETMIQLVKGARQAIDEAKAAGRPTPPARKADTGDDEDIDEAALKELMTVSPYEGWKKAQAIERKKVAAVLAGQTKYFQDLVEKTAKTTDERRSVEDELKRDYPDVFDPDSALFKRGKELLETDLSELGDTPKAWRLAARLAATELGVTPRAREIDSRGSVAAQNVSRRGTRAERDGDEFGVKNLTEKQKGIADRSGVTYENYARMLGARKTGKIVRRED